MTITQWNELPELMRRAQVLSLGVPSELLRCLTEEVASAEDFRKLPPRTIAALRPKRPDGRRARRLYIKDSLRVFVAIT